jgi:hypothetical protein
VPSTLVEVVKRVPIDELDQAYTSGSFQLGDRAVPFFWLGALLQSGVRGSSAGRSQPVLVIRSASQRVALHVDEVLGNQEVVVKNLGPQLSRLPGLAGITLLPSGAVALIYNPVALATLYGDGARAQLRQLPGRDEPVQPVPAEVLAPLVLVIDDSLTVRRVTQRLLSREGYRVSLAKDGLDALEQLSRLPGLAGITLLPSGAVALIYNPVALAGPGGAGRDLARSPQPYVRPPGKFGQGPAVWAYAPPLSGPTTDRGCRYCLGAAPWPKMGGVGPGQPGGGGRSAPVGL